MNFENFWGEGKGVDRGKGIEEKGGGGEGKGVDRGKTIEEKRGWKKKWTWTLIWMDKEYKSSLC